MSHIPFRIIYKLRYIFNLFNIKHKSLNDMFSKFNKNISMQIAIGFECNFPKDNDEN